MKIVALAIVLASFGCRDSNEKMGPTITVKSNMEETLLFQGAGVSIVLTSPPFDEEVGAYNEAMYECDSTSESIGECLADKPYPSTKLLKQIFLRSQTFSNSQAYSIEVPSGDYKRLDLAVSAIAADGCHWYSYSKQDLQAGDVIEIDKNVLEYREIPCIPQATVTAAP